MQITMFLQRVDYWVNWLLSMLTDALAVDRRCLQNVKTPSVESVWTNAILSSVLEV